MPVRELQELEAELHYCFNDSGLLKKALTHSSHAHEQNTREDNEQLEFLGDAILGFVVSDLLCRAYPAFTEGQLSRLKGFFVSAANLVKYAESIKLGHYLHLGKGEEKTGGRTKQALLVDGFEAIIGAMYLDGGLAVSQAFITRFVDQQISEISGETAGLAAAFIDFKTALQELLHARSLGSCRYNLVGESGPDHQKLFTVEILLGGEAIARGIGLTKRAAEQAAAKQALEDFNRREQGYWSNDRSDVQEIDRTRVL